MGYTTDFEGEFILNRPLSPNHKAYLKAFCATRRMYRNKIAESYPDPLRLAVGLPFGSNGAYFVGSKASFGQDLNDPSVQIDETDYPFVVITSENRYAVEMMRIMGGNNVPPMGQPGLWCQWTPNDKGTAIIWNGGEKFYKYVDWLQYIITHFFDRWGYILNGTVTYQGEDYSDRGQIQVVNNVITVIEDEVDEDDDDEDDDNEDDNDSDIDNDDNNNDNDNNNNNNYL